MFRKPFFLFLLAVMLLAGCTALPELSGDVTAEETESAEVAVDGSLPIEINNFAGTITVREGDSNRVAATVIKESRLENVTDAQAQLEEITLTVEQTGSRALVEVDGPDNEGNLADMEIGMTAQLEVTVPPGSDLTINLGAGEITLEQPTGDASVNSGAGAATAILPGDASFRLVVTGGVAGVESEFEGVPDGGLATDIDTTIGSNPTQTLSFNIGAGEVNLQKAP